MLKLWERLLRGSHPQQQIEEYSRHPVELSYRKASHLVTKVDVSFCRMNLTGIYATDNPYVRMLQEESHVYENSLLHRYYDSVKPETVGELFKLTDSRIASFPSMAAVMPWWDISPQKRLEQVAVQTANGWLGKEALKLGASDDCDFGWPYFGPVSEHVGKIEYSRQKDVFTSISKNGYQPTSYLHIHGEFLVAGQDWVWVNQGGKHRFNALVALGITEIVVSVKKKYGPAFVRRDEVDSWPNVMSGWFSKNEALALFDQIMKGQSLGL